MLKKTIVDHIHNDKYILYMKYMYIHTYTYMCVYELTFIYDWWCNEKIYF